MRRPSPFLSTRRVRHNIVEIPIESIDIRDETYRITTRSDTDDLVASIERVGLLNPPVVEAKGEKYLPVSGFRRIEACRKLKRQTIAARISDTEPPNLGAAMIAVCDNSLQRTLNLIETARALKMIAVHVGAPEELSRLAGDLGLPDHPRHIHKIQALLEMPPSVQKAVADGVVSLSAAAALYRLDPEAAVEICTLFCDLNIGFNRQQELLTLIEEVAAREGVSIRRILHCRALQSIRMDKDLDPVRKRQAVRKYLRQRRYPHISKTEDRFESNRRNLKLGRHMTLEPPPHFEGRAYTLKIQFCTPTELAERSKALAGLVKNPFMEKILLPPTEYPM